MSFSAEAERIVEGVKAGLYEGGTMIMAASQRLVPVETGVLKGSGRVEEPIVNVDSIEVTVGYGYGTEYAAKAEGDGDDEDEVETGPGYGIYVHEILENRHNPPTGAKFLELPARAFEPELVPTIEAAIRARTGRR